MTLQLAGKVAGKLAACNMFSASPTGKKLQAPATLQLFPSEWEATAKLAGKVAGWTASWRVHAGVEVNGFRRPRMDARAADTSRG
jgi:hypothetical protein